MARRKAQSKTTTVLFNVVYEDGALSSNRKVSSELLENLYGEDPEDLIRVAIEEQDRVVAERSGYSKGKIKSITRVG
ncbi:MAG: hypothetical protein HN644_06635 [Rhodospirillales bacterium]|jgi:hypothetical protein|nr:hypothetical protein [Rhodospirillales bacterium]MBT4038774.1 hypothetical protein [Rhodospirillales bacterium]MBT4627319.1 hypothetical protein [Rhodospirillales bacterium]MBT5353145.1 hypothetical protein [Rhodospirillales bacterium]MBT5520814.1 hypothetical protein [Rhodospirillales bacterium]